MLWVVSPIADVFQYFPVMSNNASFSAAEFSVVLLRLLEISVRSPGQLGKITISIQKWAILVANNYRFPRALHYVTALFRDDSSQDCLIRSVPTDPQFFPAWLG
jgi:hypothetical protein